MVRDAFAARGWEAVSCDLLPTEREPAPGARHYQGDVRDILAQRWDLMVGHPDCTFMANSGAQWLYEDWTEEERARHLKKTGKALMGRSPRPNIQRWLELEEATSFYRLLWDTDIPHIALENPTMHGHASRRIGGKADQFVQPWMFGTPESKATGLRLKNLPKLVPHADADEVLAHGRTLPDKVFQRVFNLPPSPDRWKERSRTFPGVAQAMADQWGPYIEAKLEAAGTVGPSNQATTTN